MNELCISIISNFFKSYTLLICRDTNTKKKYYMETLFFKSKKYCAINNKYRLRTKILLIFI